MAFKTLLTALLFSAAITSSADTNKQTYESGPQQVQLLELYTSEGCSSCPPADRWMSRLKNSGELWKRFVPITFHVAYWDYIGWDDKYARKDFDQRQYRHHKQGGVGSVYTPGFVLNGEEWRGFFQHADELPKPTENAVGNLVLSIDGDEFTARFERDSQQLHIAILAMGLSTQVKRGENRGRSLTHDFVVVGYQYYQATDGRWQDKLPTIAHQAKEYAIAAWVSDSSSQKPIQALGGTFTPTQP